MIAPKRRILELGIWFSKPSKQPVQKAKPGALKKKLFLMLVDVAIYISELSPELSASLKLLAHNGLEMP